MFKTNREGNMYEVNDPVGFPKASGFLWNNHMMIHVNSRGYVVSQFMQPEPAKYSKGPNIEAKTFMQPEQGYYTDHPGRFMYIKDEASRSVFSVPYEPMRVPLDSFRFVIEKHRLSWHNTHEDIAVDLSLTLPTDRPVELWRGRITNQSDSIRHLSVYPSFTVGYMSWMNQSGYYDEALQSVLCDSITPYQKYPDYFEMKEFKDMTFMAASVKPDGWEVRQEAFYGEGGVIHPSGIDKEVLSGSDALYEVPCAVMQYRITLAPGESKSFKFLFGPAKDKKEVEEIIEAYYGKNDKGFEQEEERYEAYINEGIGPITIDTPDERLNHFVNQWLPRQVYYHGITNRLSTDPQTRNYLQDNMGMTYIRPSITREAFIKALSQQASSGAMPDGILLYEGATLKYINQVPHTDHCTWLPICMKAYLDETDDYALLEEEIPFKDSEQRKSVIEHMSLAMEWLLQDRNEQGLNYIKQGDWCDPMNMVGYKGKGVSGWLTLATTYAISLWADILEQSGQKDRAKHYADEVTTLRKIANNELWDRQWYIRGITDEGTRFGTEDDKEGKIFLNPQSFGILSGAAEDEKQSMMIRSVKQYLETPYGYEMLAPAFTTMREDVGRVTQKFPGSAENGAIYNHAAAFYAYAMFMSNHHEEGFNTLSKMIPGPDIADILHREQLPIFVPNYYRGAYEYYERTCGRSSQLFNTGTASWVYRCIIEGVFGLVGSRKGLVIKPGIPKAWTKATIIRQFREATFKVKYIREEIHREPLILVNGQELSGNTITDIIPQESYEVTVYL